MQIKSSKKIALIELLQELSPDSSKNTLRSWVEKGRVTINGKEVIRVNTLVEKDQTVVVGSKQKFLPQGLKIIYEDEDLVVVDKPAGLLSVATEKETYLSIHTLLKRRFNTGVVYPIHRLDKETSGLLVFAYNQTARDALKKQLEERSMGREYRALVHGHPGQGVWECNLRENIRLFVEVCPDSMGKVAITHYETLKVKGECSLLKLKLKTGRKHQIRVQAAHHGYPLVGDTKYGLEKDKHKKHLYLQAVLLSFIHPTTGKMMEFTSPPQF